MRRALACLLALVVAGCGDRPRGAAPPPRAPVGSGWNVVLITIDTLRADHLGCYGYRRNTSPRIDALARAGAVFERAYTYWPKTRGSMVVMFSGRMPARNGYSKSHPVLLGFNPTIADVLKQAGYATAAAVDNPNVAAQHGYARGFEAYRETWEESGLASETDRARAITDSALRVIAGATAGRPFFLWLHYVSPHAPYTPPAPFDTAFLDDASRAGSRLAVVPGFHDGIPEQWAVAGQDRLGYYVAQYDGEIAAADQEVGRVLDALAAAGAMSRTLVVISSDHGESLGEHGYYFDHGENLFDPSLRVPLIVAAPGAPRGVRSDALASTLDIFPTILDAAKVSYPPDLAGRSLLANAMGRAQAGPERLFAQNERGLSGTFGARYKLVGAPAADSLRFALYDRERDPGETRDASRTSAGQLETERGELERFLAEADREREQTRRLIGADAGPKSMSAEACAKLKSLGYVGVAGCDS